jgi:signal transduction histidine kinase
VLHNILERSLDLVAVGGRIRVESRKSGEFVVVEIAHDGLHRPGDLLDELFVPFRSARAGSPRAASRSRSSWFTSTAARSGCAATASGTP